MGLCRHRLPLQYALRRQSWLRMSSSWRKIRKVKAGGREECPDGATLTSKTFMKQRRQASYYNTEIVVRDMEKLYVNEIRPEGEVSTWGCTIHGPRPERSLRCCGATRIGPAVATRS